MKLVGNTKCYSCNTKDAGLLAYFKIVNFKNISSDIWVKH